jgi:hypothetical protein
VQVEKHLQHAAILRGLLAARMCRTSFPEDVTSGIRYAPG